MYFQRQCLQSRQSSCPIFSLKEWSYHGCISNLIKLQFIYNNTVQLSFFQIKAHFSAQLHKIATVFILVESAIIAHINNSSVFLHSYEKHSCVRVSLSTISAQSNYPSYNGWIQVLGCPPVRVSAQDMCVITPKLLDGWFEIFTGGSNSYWRCATSEF